MTEQQPDKGALKVLRERAVRRLSHQVAAQIHSAMAARDVTSGELAEMAGIPLATIKRLLAGTHTSGLRPIADIAWVLECDIGFRFFRREPKAPAEQVAEGAVTHDEVTES